MYIVHIVVHRSLFMWFIMISVYNAALGFDYELHNGKLEHVDMAIAVKLMGTCHIHARERSLLITNITTVYRE